MIFKAITYFFIFATGPAWGWGDLGHEIVGEVAEQNLTPAAKTFVQSILGIEPLAVAAIWPDHVRDDPRFGHRDPDAEARKTDPHDFSPYHFCDIPKGYTYASKPVKTLKDAHGAIEHSIQLLKAGNAPMDERIIALRYLIHIVGDIHQPLHIGNGYDRGANACEVRFQRTSRPVRSHQNLHHFWDTTILTYLGGTLTSGRKSLRYYPQYIQAMKQQHPEMFDGSTKAQTAAGGLDGWISESQTIRDNGVYPDDPQAMADVPAGEEYKHRSYCKWYADQDGNGTALESEAEASNEDTNKSTIATLDRAYADRFAPVAEMQLLKAGVRLSFILDQIAAAAPSQNIAGVNDLLQAVQTAFENL